MATKQSGGDGDETVWRAAVSEFLHEIADDDALNGKFQYMVTIGKDGKSRVHVGRWDEPETVKQLQATDFFAKFSGTLKRLAGDSLDSTLFDIHQANY